MKKIFGLFIIIFIFTIVSACGSNTTGSPSESTNEGATNNANEDFEPIEIKFGTVSGPASSFYAGFQKFIDVIEEKSEGRLKPVMYDSGQLGGEREIAEALQIGNLETANISSVVLANFVPEMGFIDLPYLADTFDETWELLNGPVMEKVNEYFIENGMRPVGWGSIEFKKVNQNSHPIRVPADMQGLKFRSPENNFMPDYYRELGASPIPVPFPDIYSGMQQGLIDGFDSGPENTLALSLNETYEYTTVTNFFTVVSGYFINEEVYQSLPEDLQKVVDEAGHEAAVLTQEIAVQAENEGLVALEEEGIEIIELTPEELDLWKEAALPIYEKAADVFNPEFYEILDQELGLSDR